MFLNKQSKERRTKTMLDFIKGTSLIWLLLLEMYFAEMLCTLMGVGI